jgi:hypothetical protein
MTTAALAIALLALGHPHARPGDDARARILAAQINHAARKAHVDPILLSALVARESSFNPHARGKAGELGYGQLKRNTVATRGYDNLTDEALMQPPVNLWLTARHMARARRLCGNAPPVEWLSLYRGTKRCRATRYSRAIVAAAARAMAAVRATTDENVLGRDQGKRSHPTSAGRRSPIGDRLNAPEQAPGNLRASPAGPRHGLELTQWEE